MTKQNTKQTKELSEVEIISILKGVIDENLALLPESNQKEINEKLSRLGYSDGS